MSTFSSPYAHAARLIDSGLSVQDSLRKVSGESDTKSIMEFGASPSLADNSVAFQAAVDWASGEATPSCITFPAGIYKYTVSPNWAVTRICLLSLGAVIFRYEGFGNAFIADGGTGVFDIRASRFYIEGTVGNAVYLRHIHHGKFDFNVRGCSLAGIKTEGCVANHIDFTCSANEAPFVNDTPTYGIHSAAGDFPSAYNTYTNPIVEAVKTGIYLEECSGERFIHGTSEGNTVLGLKISNTSHLNVIDGVDFEANAGGLPSGYDVEVGGAQNKFENIASDSMFKILSGARFNSVQNSSLFNIEVEAGATLNMITQCVYDRHGIIVGTYVDNGTDTLIRDLINARLTTVQWSSSQTLNITDYGALGNTVTDDTASIQAAIDDAGSKGKELFIPAGSYLVTDTLNVTKGMIIRGEGDKSRILVDPSATDDIFSISPSSDGVNTGFIFEDFRIAVISGTPGRHGIAIDIQTRAAYNMRFTGLRIDQLGGSAIRTIPNATPLIDGFFTSVIQNCTLYGGVYLDKAGDSIRIENNTITGTNVGVYADLVGVGLSDGGAHGLDIIGNNITCNDGALQVVNAWAGRFMRNNVEVPTPSALPNDAAVSIDGAAGNIIRGFVISNNMLTTGDGYDTVFVGRSQSTLVEGNYVARKAGRHSYVVGANSINAVICNNTEALDEAMSTVLSDSGTSTLWYRTWGGQFELNQTINQV